MVSMLTWEGEKMALRSRQAAGQAMERVEAVNEISHGLPTIIPT